MDLTTLLSDDQIAVMGCFAALAFCGLVAAITFHFGPAGKKALQSREITSLRMSTESGARKSEAERKAA